MIESENLRTASLYINNQLLSRGLLRDGNGIDFARPGDDDAEVAETMSRIMAVVNDLILRRDVSTFYFLSAPSSPPLTDPCSAMPNTASPSRPPCAPSAPSHCARPTTSSACRRNTRTPSARSA
jgi:hypothetical protein